MNKHSKPSTPGKRTSWRRRKGGAASATEKQTKCLRVFLSVGGSLAGAIAYAESIFKSTGPIRLQLQAQLQRSGVGQRLPPGPLAHPFPLRLRPGQGRAKLNVRYVIKTRTAEKSLTLIKMENYVGL